jgi:probable rRNA maturation factor
MYEVMVQRAIAAKSLPSAIKLKRWAIVALTAKIDSAEMTIRIVDKREMIELNSTYRHKHKPTNVLSFPFDMPEECDELRMLGDIVICAEVIQEEAQAQQKTLEAHWAHMVIHGTLHLLGFDHERNEDAEIMEAEEINLLRQLGFANPYQEAGEQQ